MQPQDYQGDGTPEMKGMEVLMRSPCEAPHFLDTQACRDWDPRLDRQTKLESNNRIGQDRTGLPGNDGRENAVNA